jgi:hypothetical protein
MSEIKRNPPTVTEVDTLTVGELIATLKDYPDYYPVFVETHGDRDITRVIADETSDGPAVFLE